MSRKLLVVLFLCSIQPFIIGNGLMPLLPVYAKDLGAGSGSTGLFLAISYAALVLGSLAAGWVSSTFQRRRLALIIGTSPVSVVLWLMGRVSTPGQLAVLMGVCWFLGGFGVALLNILGGLFAEKQERGRVFGILGLAQGLGALLGGLTIGAIADRWGYPVLFTCLGITGFAGPLLSLLVDDKPSLRRGTSAKERASAPFSAAFYIVLGAGVIAAIAQASGRLGASLGMDALAFSSASITGTAAAAGIISMAATPLIGRLSDRFNRKLLLVACYVVGSAGLAVLALSGAVWHFWLGVSLISVQAYAGPSVAAALTADIVPGRSLDKALAMLSASPYLGGVIGYAASGLLMDAAGISTVLMAFAAFALLAVGMLTFVRARPAAAA